MTPEEKITELVEYIKKKFPQGYREVVDCETCPLNITEHATVEEDVCNILSSIEYRVAKPETTNDK